MHHFGHLPRRGRPKERLRQRPEFHDVSCLLLKTAAIEKAAKGVNEENRLNNLNILSKLHAHFESREARQRVRRVIKKPSAK